MITHQLKTLSQYWDAVKRGDKTFDVRRDDRGFQKGDTVELIRYNGIGIAYRTELPDSTGPGGRYDKATYTLSREITYILTGGQFGIEPGYVVLALKKLEAR